MTEERPTVELKYFQNFGFFLAARDSVEVQKKGALIMSMWLYQLDEAELSLQRFRCDIWENQRWHWGLRTIRTKDQSKPEPGDVIVMFYTKAGAKQSREPGIYGWAVVEGRDDTEHALYFIPTAPTNRLKMDPWWDDEAKSVTDDIRKGIYNLYEGTLFKVANDKTADDSDKIPQRIRDGINNWLSQPRPQPVD